MVLLFKECFANVQKTHTSHTLIPCICLPLTLLVLFEQGRKREYGVWKKDNLLFLLHERQQVVLEWYKIHVRSLLI